MIFHDWTETEIIPSPDAWYQYQPGGSGHHIIYDSSGNERTLEGVEADAPVLTENVVGGHPAWYFDGTVEPLSWTGAVTFNHVFILASNEDATFATYQGLLTGETVGDILVGDNGTTKFFNLGIGGRYTKEGVVYLETDMQAPMQEFQLLEVRNVDGILLDGIQIGQQRADVTRRWQGHFAEMICFERLLTRDEVRRIRLYFNVKFGEHARGLPLHFPSADIVPTIGPSRFYPAPEAFSEITDDFQYEDGTKDFNEVADSAPIRFEYAYPAVPKAQLPIFDEFWRQARLVNPFLFKDPDSNVWTNVRVEEYNRNHPGHMRWRHDVAFRLVGYNSVGTYEQDEEPTVPFLSITSTDYFEIGLGWTASTDNNEVAGYEYRVDGGAPVDVGNVLIATAGGLTDSTTYTFEVRAYDNDENFSAWSNPVAGTTDSPAVVALTVDGVVLTADGTALTMTTYI